MLQLPSCTIVTAPVDGRLRQLTPVDTRVEAGEVVAQFEGLSGVVDLRAHRAGRVGGSLAGTDQLVARGEAVLWLAS